MANYGTPDELHKARARLGWTITIRNRHVAKAEAKTEDYDRQISEWESKIAALETEAME